MLRLINTTPFAGNRAVLVDPTGSTLWVVTVKATFAFDAYGTVRLADNQEPVVTTPQYAAEPGASSLSRDVEPVFTHPGTAVTVYGSATPLRDEDADEVNTGTAVSNASSNAANAGARAESTQLDVGFDVGKLSRTVCVFGARVWQDASKGLEPSPPAPIERVTLDFESAFGGTSDTSAEDEAEHPPHFAPNPIGVGYYPTAEAALGQPLPQIEDPDHLITAWDDRPPPARLGAVPPMFEPRSTRAGTYDERWQRERAPLWPEDFDERHLNAAPDGQVALPRLRGGERFTLRNIAGRAHVSFLLPRVFLTVRTVLPEGAVRRSPVLDRVIVEADRGELIMVWRSSLDCGPSARRVRESLIDTLVDVRTGRNDGLPADAPPSKLR